MKHLFLTILILFSFSLFAQKQCEYSTNVVDSIGSYKVTKEYMISEKNFAGTSSYIFFSLALTDGIPTLNIQLIQKSKGFIKANCFDKNSKLFLQLNDGSIISLIHKDQENCGTLLRDDKGFDNRVTSGEFYFVKDSFDKLKNSPISLMRIKYLTDLEDYAVKKEFTSELDNKVYFPETYFIKNLSCIEN
ncbi:hypothetical protein BXU11_13630 [Flavobacterium sp. LM5]|uniref:hypothetical protein n=1 Tax=Flavobacterium sp. LM5 TaxID=1938610 RepID=UPI000992CC3C|nr:hypothetical protein [Flavobacterium sp. LM5]OOV26511.1 hypothetical protein BXU11_13630 [Flavobacterium sp. LM5]